MQLLKQIGHLEEELTNAEGTETQVAKRRTQNRQKQEKEEIINSAEILQEEGQRLIDDIALVSLWGCTLKKRFINIFIFSISLELALRI